jgi:hypothetical protein|tara:strand:- start:1925 stop:2590 length:666 start_codon:yes stop_codon:yes gene_type:complete
MIKHDVVQRSEAWHLLRSRKIGGSDAIHIQISGKRETVGRRDARNRLALARLGVLPVAEPVFVSEAMERGIRLEHEALHAWEVQSGRMVEAVGYLESEAFEDTGCSPDGMCGTTLIEVKCAKPSLHWQYMQGFKSESGISKIPKIYQPQILHSALVSHCQTVEFVSYCPAFVPGAILGVASIPRAEIEGEVGTYAKQLARFLAEVARECQAITLSVNDPNI